MKGVAFEGFETFDFGQFWFGQNSVRADDETRSHMVAMIGFDAPHLLGLVPYRRCYRGLKDGKFIEVVFSRDRLAVGENLLAAGVVLSRDIIEFVKQRQIIIGYNVAGDPGVAVPIPGAADVRGALYDTNTLDPDL